MKKRHRRRQQVKRDTPIAAIAIGLSIIILWFVANVAGSVQSTENKTTVPVAPTDTLKIEVLSPQPYISLYDEKRGVVLSLPAEDYVLGSVAAEMPALFHDEALKAQAVACRTWLAMRLQTNGCPNHPEADVCSSYLCCQAWQNNDELKAKWGDEYIKYLTVIKKAVSDTRGEIMTYNGKAVTAFYHSISGGKTADAVTVFGIYEPYLVSVDSPGEQVANRFFNSVEYDFDELYQKVRSTYPDVILTPGSISEQLKILQRDNTGRVSQFMLGNRTITGVQARNLFGIGSANFDVEIQGLKIKFNAIGHGHGVGMSQYGANAMAKEGNNYQEILTHYYTGVAISTIWE
ncbi:MAG TPA: stage II sporulation protein D [Clostridia bacterium]|nr:stage II sporulation protein D [Clostridia bacterium]